MPVGASDATLSAVAEDPDHGYVLGHSEREMRRLAAQARMVDPITERFFREAGLGAGMRVLDVGSGAGDVTFLVAGLVGESGQVIGVDRSLNAVARATERAGARSWPNVGFVHGDPAQMSFDAPFDAVVG